MFFFGIILLSWADDIGVSTYPIQSFVQSSLQPNRSILRFYLSWTDFYCIFALFTPCFSILTYPVVDGPA